MNDLSLFILDIVQNSIKANSKNINIRIVESSKENILSIEITDDGCGMDEDILIKVENPFYTTRTTRKVGLGIPLFKETCITAGGRFEIKSKRHEGTKLLGEMQCNHVDRLPLGDLAETLYTIIINDEEIDISFEYQYNFKTFILNTKEIKDVLEGVSFRQYDVMIWIKSYIKNGLMELKQ